MYLGFLLAAYSVIGNDVIQTLGTFLTSNEKRPWWVLALYSSAILVAVLLYGWYVNGGDVSYGRLIGNPDVHSLENPKFANPEDVPGFGWAFLLPPVILLIITRFGIPVSTSFLILTFFNPENLYDMVVKSMAGYMVAFVAAVVIYMAISKSLEKRFEKKKPHGKELRYWTMAQWLSTAFLWSQWLIQDFANIYVYLPRKVDEFTLLWTILVFVILIGFIFYSKGGAIQAIVKAKTNTQDVRSATIIDLAYALVLLFFKELNNVPMSTTWVFIGILAGREITIRYLIHGKVKKATLRDMGKDLLRVFFGLVVSIILVFVVRWITVGA